jgi:hypothetical protein
MEIKPRGVAVPVMFLTFPLMDASVGSPCTVPSRRMLSDRRMLFKSPQTSLFKTEG